MFMSVDRSDRQPSHASLIRRRVMAQRKVRGSIVKPALALVALLCTASAGAGVNRWTVIGPPASMHAMAIDPHNPRLLYAAGSETVARSDDRGTTWTSTPVSGLFQPSAIRVSPSLPSTIYVLGLSDLFRSTTGGTSWTHSRVPTAAQFPNDLQVDTTNAATLTLAASNFCFLGCSGGGVFRSDNGGDSWRLIGLKDTNVQSVALDPTNPQIIYATSGSTLFRTTNGGGSWKAISPPTSGTINVVVVDPLLSRTIYAATASGVFRSDDSGLSWELMRASAYGSLIAAPAPGSRQIFAAASGTALSLNEGRTWLELSTTGSGLAFDGLLQLAFRDDAYYMVSDLQGVPGQVLSYELQQPRRRAAPK